MKEGEVINGYRLVTSPTNSGGGMCVWAFAAKGGRDYFIKAFLQPKWPTPESMGSEAGKERRRDDCHDFERRHNEVMSRLADATTSPGGGNLVTAFDFFRAGTTYYKVTEKVVTASIESLAELAVRERAVILRTLVLSLRMLHRKDIVHGDLKPPNVLIQKVPDSGLHTAKLIDFDDSYLSGSPPPRDQIVGDSIYGSPEWFGYTKNDTSVTAAMLTKAADIFALGLLFHYYLVGALPYYDNAKYSAPGQAVILGEPLTIDVRLSPALTALLKNMTAARPADRPTIDLVFQGLKDLAALEFRSRESAARKLYINVDRPSPGATSPVSPVGGLSESTSRVRINLSGKPKER